MGFLHQFGGNRSTTPWSEILWKLSLSGLFILICVYHVRSEKVLVGCFGGRNKLYSADVDVSLDHLDFTLIMNLTRGTVYGITHNPNNQYFYFTEEYVGIYKCDIDTMACQQIIGLGARGLRGIAVYNDTLYYVDDTDDTIYKTNEDGQKESIYTHQGNLWGIDIDRRDSMIYFIDWSNNKLISIDIEGQNVTDVLSGIGELRNIEIDQTARDLYIGTSGVNAKLIRLNLDTKEQTELYNQGRHIYDLAILDKWIVNVENFDGLKVVNMSGTPHPVTVSGFECSVYKTMHVIANHASTTKANFISSTPSQIETTDSNTTVTIDGSSLNTGTTYPDHTTDTISTTPSLVKTTNVGSQSVASLNASVTAKITTTDHAMTTEEIAEDHSTVTDMFSSKWTPNFAIDFPDLLEEDLLSAFETFTSIFPASLEVGVRIKVIVNNTQIEMVKYKLNPREEEFDSDYKQPLTVSLTAAFINAESNKSGFVTISLLKTPNRVRDFEEDSRDNKKQVVGSVLLSINFFTETGNLQKHENEKHPFNVTFPIKQLNETDTMVQPRRVCSFWDKENEQWSQEGSFSFETMSMASSQTCAFTHLTTFAVLFDFSEDDNRSDYSPIAEIFTMIVSSISVIALSIGLVIFALLWKRPPIDKEKMIIHCQLMVVMAIAYVLNMLTKSAQPNQTACLVIAILKYNMFLNMFSVMFIEAVHLFRMIVIVFGGQRNFKPIYAAISFGLPLILTLITSAIGQDQLHDEQSCWLARKYIWNFIAPVAALLTANVLILVSVVWQILMVAAEDRIQSARIGLRSTLLLLPMLGTSWLVGLLANTSLVATYMFDILSSLQGIYLVAVIFVMNSEVRKATLEWFRANILASQLTAGMNLRRVRVQPAPAAATIDTTN